MKVEESGKVSMIAAEMKGEVKHKELESKLHRTKTSLETYRIGEIAKAEATSVAERITADVKEEEMIIEGTWKMQKMICEAEATKHDASAEKEASRTLVAKRTHEMDLREKRILGELGESGKFNLIGTTGDQMLFALMTGSLPKAGSNELQKV